MMVGDSVSLAVVCLIIVLISVNCDIDVLPPNRKSQPKLQPDVCDYCSLGYSNTYCSYRLVSQSHKKLDTIFFFIFNS